MTRTKLGLLALCAMVFGLMAIGAGAAQAEVGAKWLILDKAGHLFTGSELPSVVQAQLEEGSTAALLTHILGKEVKITCNAGELENATLEGNGSISSGGRVVFTGCETFIEGKLEEACTPSAGGGASGTVKTNKGHGLIVLILENLPGVKILPDSGETFVTLNMGEECSIGESVPVKGVLYIEDCKGEFSTHKAIHLIVADNTHSTLYVISDTAEHLETSLDGSAEAFLIGKHIGLEFSGDAI